MLGKATLSDASIIVAVLGFVFGIIYLVIARLKNGKTAEAVPVTANLESNRKLAKEMITQQYRTCDQKFNNILENQEENKDLSKKILGYMEDKPGSPGLIGQVNKNTGDLEKNDKHHEKFFEHIDED